MNSLALPQFGEIALIDVANSRDRLFLAGWGHSSSRGDEGNREVRRDNRNCVFGKSHFHSFRGRFASSTISRGRGESTLAPATVTA